MKHRSHIKPVFITFLGALIVTGCSAGKVRDQLGLTRESPDEFAVVRRAPLEVPEDLLATDAVLPAPKAGMARPQETAPDVAARQTLLGLDNKTGAAASLSAADQAFLSRTGANDNPADIRARIDSETAKLHDRNKPVAEKLLGIGGDRYQPSATVVDAEKEAQRLRANKEEGKAITDGETPSIEE